MIRQLITKEAPNSTKEPTGIVRILHLSDTHGLHWTIEDEFPMPPADILIHSGDFTQWGRPAEYEDFNRWLDTLKDRYRYIVCILGNHEWRAVSFDTPPKAVVAFQLELAADPTTLKQKLEDLLPGATHVLEHEMVELCGLRIYGSSWCPWQRAANPEELGTGNSDRLLSIWRDTLGMPPQDVVHRFHEIPPCDVLVTHGPPHGILSCREGVQEEWGSSSALLQQIWQVQPAAHLFGHLHEQRGVWYRCDGMVGFSGGVEYQRMVGERWLENETSPPPDDYPCQLVSCNAMKNHGRLELEHWMRKPRICGPARLVIARRDSVTDSWRFSIT